MVFNAIGRIIGYFFFIITVAFLLTNTVLFVGFLVYDELVNYRTSGELTTMSITEIGWVEILQFQPKYIFVYIVVGLFVLIRYILWSFNEFRTAVRESKDKARKSKELEIARKHNHKQRLIEYRQEEQELEKLEQNLDLQTTENLDGKKLLETVENDEQVDTEPTNEPREDEETKPKTPKKVKVVTARKRSTVDKDLNPNQNTAPPTETKVERMIREKEEREQKEDKLRRQARKRNKERERKQQEMSEKYQSEEEDDKDFKIKGVFNRKD